MPQRKTRTARLEAWITREAQEKFAALLLHPPALTPALKKAFERHRAVIAE
jgi:hypothetical protein